jgi:hypothetical protein
MDAIDSIPGNVEKWAQFLTEACAALEDAKRRIEALEKENALLKKQLADTTPKVDDPYSLRAEEQRQQQRGRRKKRQETKKQRRGRIANEEKSKRAEKSEDVYPQGVAIDQCRLSHLRVVWRLQEGRAVLVAYRVFRGPKKQ